MILCTIIVALCLSSSEAALWNRSTKKSTSFAASTFAGATTSAIFPPPDPTNTGTAIEEFFPTDVGFAGPTPTGDEAEAIATATALPKLVSAFPLLNPSTFGNKSNSFNVLRLWGNLAPQFSVDTFGLPEANQLIPNGCAINQVHLVHRHGARYPTSGSPPAAFAAKLHNATVAGTGYTGSGDLEFLNTWTYKLGAELLTPFGREQMFDLGVAFRIKYGALLKGFANLPVFRTESEDRMLHSALNFAAGFFGVPMYQTDYHQVITIENPGFNNTLAPYDTCTNANNDIGNFGSVQAAKWVDIYLQDALKRLSPQIKGLNLTITDLFGMQQTCAYEESAGLCLHVDMSLTAIASFQTVALGFSAFCDLFTQEEWEGFEYANDLSFWYGIGPGNPTSAAQGIGYVQELIARLTQTPIPLHNTTTNATITDSNITFPLDQPIFVDATHDVVISNIVVALNFTSLAANGPLPTDHIPKRQTWFTNQIAPFGSNLVGQVLSCTGSSTPTHIRWILNDAVVPLTGVNGCKASKDGLCPLDTFINAMKTRIGEVDFAFDCLANYTIPIPDLIVDGQAPTNLKNKH